MENKKCQHIWKPLKDHQIDTNIFICKFCKTIKHWPIDGWVYIRPNNKKA